MNNFINVCGEKQKIKNLDKANYTVTHWIPMPKPAKGEDNDGFRTCGT